MKKILKNILLCSVFGGSLLFTNCDKKIVDEYAPKIEIIKEQLITTPKNNFLTEDPSNNYSSEEENTIHQDKTPMEIFFSSGGITQDTQSPSVNTLLEGLPGHKFKEMVFEKIDKKRYFDERDYRKYVIGTEEGITIYDLDKDGVFDLGAKFDDGSTFANVVSINLNKDLIPEFMYADLDKEGILERKATISLNGISYEDLRISD